MSGWVGGEMSGVVVQALVIQSIFLAACFGWNALNTQAHNRFRERIDRELQEETIRRKISDETEAELRFDLAVNLTREIDAINAKVKADLSK